MLSKPQPPRRAGLTSQDRGNSGFTALLSLCLFCPSPLLNTWATTLPVTTQVSARSACDLAYSFHRLRCSDKSVLCIALPWKAIQSIYYLQMLQILCQYEPTCRISAPASLSTYLLQFFYPSADPMGHGLVETQVSSGTGIHKTNGIPSHQEELGIYNGLLFTCQEERNHIMCRKQKIIMLSEINPTQKDK